MHQNSNEYPANLNFLCLTKTLLRNLRSTLSYNYFVLPLMQFRLQFLAVYLQFLRNKKFIWKNRAIRPLQLIIFLCVAIYLLYAKMTETTKSFRYIKIVNFRIRTLACAFTSMSKIYCHIWYLLPNSFFL